MSNHGFCRWAAGYFCALSLVCVLLTIACPRSFATSSVDVTTYHNDQARTGQNPNETILTPANVGPGIFGRLFAYPVDGYVYAQPLYLSNVAIPRKGRRDIVIVATEHDSVYAFDADASSPKNPIWKTSFLDPSAGVTSVPYLNINSADLQPEIGITGTPVIDARNGTLFVVAKTMQSGPSGVTYAFNLHALDVTTGAERPGSPVLIDAAYPGTSSDAVNGSIPFNSQREHDRMGLLLLNGIVYIPFASHGDNQPYHGWLLGYDARTLRQVSVFNGTPASGLGGFWEGGGAPTADATGNIYLSTGNAAFDASKANYGDSVLKISTTGNKLSVADYFAPFDQAAMDANDADLGSGAILLLPRDATSAAHPDVIVTAGKEGKLYALDCGNLGGYDPASDHVLQSVAGLGGLFACPAYFNGTIFFPGSGQPLEALSVANGQISTSPVAYGSVNLGGRVATPSVSSEGVENGIVWIVQVGSPGILYAFDAGDIARELYRSDTDAIPEGIKFSAPTVANGRVFVGSSNCLVVFGLLDKATSAPPTPSHLAHAGVTDSSARLTWTVPPGATISSFRIEMRGGVQHGWTLAGTVARDQFQFTATRLLPRSRYDFRVTSTNSFADSKASRSIRITTLPLAVSDGLCAYWPLDDGQGNIARDTISGAPAGTVEGEYTWTPAPDGTGSVLTLHGTGNAPSQVVVRDTAALRFSAKQSFTWCATVSAVTPITRSQAILSKARNSPSWAQLGIDASGAWTFSGPSGSLTGGIATDGPHMVIAVQDATKGTRDLYVDGRLIASGPAQDANGAGDLWIGASETGGAGFMGQITAVRVYARPLTIAEVQTLSAIR